MDTRDFNENASLPRFGYQRSPVHPRAFQILQYGGAAQHAHPVGHYTVLDKEEDLFLAERKVMNLVSKMNGRDKLINLREETNSRLLFQMLSDGNDGKDYRVMFYTYTGEGSSKENALFTLEGGSHVSH